MEKYLFDLIKKNIKRFYRGDAEKDKGYAKITFNGKTVRIPARFSYVYSWDIEKLSKEMSKVTREEPEEIYARLTLKDDFRQLRPLKTKATKRTLEKRVLINSLLIVVVIILGFLVSVNSGITGNIVNNSDIPVITNTGIVLSLIVLLGILFYRIKSFLRM